MLWRLKFRSLWNRNLQDDLDDELRSHIEMKAEALQAEGMSQTEAFEMARRSFGNVTHLKEQTRDLHIFPWLESTLLDLRYGFRRLRHEPAFTLAAVLTLGLVIGANGAIFSLLEALLLRPLPFPEPDRLVMILGTNKQSQRASLAVPDLEDMQAARSLSGIAAEQVQSVNLTGVDEPGRLIGGFVSSAYFPLLGVQPSMGRGFALADDKPGSARVCLLNYGVWKDRFGADPSFLGRTLILNAEPYTVIGILPESFKPRYTNADAWIPVQHYPNYSRDRGRTPVNAIGRLAPGFSVEQAQAELDTIARQLAAQYPATNRDRGIAVQRIEEMLVRNVRGNIMLLTGAVGCVLLIGCANIAGLLLTKAAGRRQEMAIRASLGAGRGRLVRQLLTECLILSVGGGALGAALASGGIQLITTFATDVPGLTDLSINSTVLLYLAGVSLLTGLLFGLAPAFVVGQQGSRFLRQRGGATGQTGFRHVLVSAQVALALVLLIASGLLVRSLYNVASIDPGFNGERVLTMEYRLPRNKYPAGAQQTQFHHELLARLGALPGVESAGIIGSLPFSGNSGATAITLPDRPEPPADSPWIVQNNTATPGYFRTAGIPLLGGRDFLLSDGPDSLRVAIVSESFVKRFWPGQNVIGRQVNIARDAKPVPVTIIGIVGNTKQQSLDDPEEPQLYEPYSQVPYLFATLAVKTKGDALAMTRTVQRTIWSIDKDQPMWKIRTLQHLVDRSFSYRRIVVYLLTGFSALALGLAAIGLYGLLAYMVSQRTAEFGIRIAIGADPTSILGLVIRKGMLLTIFGLIAGILGALALTRLLSTQVYGVSTTDPLVYVGFSAVLLTTALIAVLFPALRAMRVDPVHALRQE